MKGLLLAILIALFISSCKKEGIERSQTDGDQRVKAALRDSLPGEQYASLNFSKGVRSQGGGDTVYFRIPFRGKSLAEHFVLVQTDKTGAVQRGRIVSLTPREGGSFPLPYNGSITLQWLSGETQLQSDIVNGYIQALHPDPNALSRLALLANPYQTLPEVIVVGYRSDWGGISYGDFFQLQSLFGSFGNSNYFESITFGGGPSGGGSSGGYSAPASGGGGFTQTPAILIDVESQDRNPGIDILKYLSCFSTIPDAGATCTMEIMADIPVDSDPSYFFNWGTGSPGHVFLKLTKKGSAGGSVQQIFGWYPKEGYKLMLTSAATAGKFVNNQHHEFNASYTVNINPEQLKRSITHISYLSQFIRYDIDAYNCTDFALDVFNQTVAPSQALSLPKFDLPGTTNPLGSNTPNGLFLKLKELKAAGGAGASGVTIPGVKGWVGASAGPCN